MTAKGTSVRGKVWRGEGVVKMDGLWGSKTFIGATKAVRESYHAYLKSMPVGARFTLTVIPAPRRKGGKS